MDCFDSGVNCSRKALGNICLEILLSLCGFLRKQLSYRVQDYKTAGLHFSSNRALRGLFETFKFDLCVLKALETTLCWPYTVYLSGR